MAELKNFIFRQEAIKLYRTFLRAVKEAPTDARGELAATVRREFESGRRFSEPYDIKYALSNGRDQLKQLQEMLAMSQ